MRHSIEELIEVAYCYYPRGVSREDPGYKRSEEHRRLVDARRRAGDDRDRWQGVLQRLGSKFPGRPPVDRSVHLPTGNYDACFSGHLCAGTRVPDERSHVVGFMVSFLVPYYIVYSLRVVDDPGGAESGKMVDARPPRHVSIFVRDTLYVLPAWVGRLVRLVRPEIVEPSASLEATRQHLSFDPSPDEQPYAAWIAQDIEATWGYERMSPLVGKIIVPDVATDSRRLGEATIYDCLFSDDW